MATTSVRLSLTRPVPFRILALSMQLETKYIHANLFPLITSIKDLRKEVSDLIERCEIIHERIQATEQKVADFKSDIQPVWNDAYNLCGDPACDGSCMVCADGEYLGEEDYEEKYCRRGRR